MEAYLISCTNCLDKKGNESVPAQIVDFYGIGTDSMDGSGRLGPFVLDLDVLRAYRANPEDYPSKYSVPRVR
jgi:hypothetical protein